LSFCWLSTAIKKYLGLLVSLLKVYGTDAILSVNKAIAKQIIDGGKWKVEACPILEPHSFDYTQMEIHVQGMLSGAVYI